jgi:haloacetate dehalogenase
VWEHADSRFALGYLPWSLLAQDEPLPEQILGMLSEAIIDNALSGWGTPARFFSPEIRAAYLDSIRDPHHVHAICEEYRAAATLDWEHDKADRAAGRRITCPLLVLWGADGALDTWYTDDGGPLELWREWGDNVQGQPIYGGHFFPEAAPEQTADLLRHFLKSAV